MTPFDYLILVLVLLVFFSVGAYALRNAKTLILSEVQKLFEKESEPVVVNFPDPIDIGPLQNQLKALSEKVFAQGDGLSKSLEIVKKTIKDTPSKTLSTIQGSVNNTAGKMGEMMQLIELQRIYDRLIVVGDIVDFIGVRFPTEDSPGIVDFIDIKTGKSAALSADQRKLRDFIATIGDGVNFKVVKVQIT